MRCGRYTTKNRTRRFRENSWRGNTIWKSNAFCGGELVAEEDYRCPLGEGLQIYTSMVDRGIPARMCIFKRGEP